MRTAAPTKTESRSRKSSTKQVARQRPIRVVLAKAGLDGHDRGIKVVARALRDAGMEVIYLGLFQTPRTIANAAVQEDPDLVGVSILSGAHMPIMKELCRLLKEQGANDIPVMLGGIVPDEDMRALQRMGVAKVFRPGASLEEIIQWIREHARRT